MGRWQSPDASLEGGRSPRGRRSGAESQHTRRVLPAPSGKIESPAPGTVPGTRMGRWGQDQACILGAQCKRRPPEAVDVWNLPPPENQVHGAWKVWGLPWSIPRKPPGRAPGLSGSTCSHLLPTRNRKPGPAMAQRAVLNEPLLVNPGRKCGRKEGWGERGRKAGGRLGGRQVRGRETGRMGGRKVGGKEKDSAEGRVGGRPPHRRCCEALQGAANNRFLSIW